MNLHKIRLLVRNFYTLDNTVLTVAVLIALSWVGGTMGTLQNNFRLQAQVDVLKQQVDQANLEAQNSALENQYFASPEYQELEARERLGLAAPGEHMLLLPANTVSDSQTVPKTSSATKTSNFQAWLNFFFGKKG